MKKRLARDLGVFSLISIACGAMVSGLLVLPGYAAGMTGPSVFAAFLLAGILFLPATLSKCEMATALPEAGGDYLFIDRSLGPLFSTISGLGMFLTLMLKSAFALVGLGAYLMLIVPLPNEFGQIAAVAVAALIIFINYRGAKKSGTFQQILFLVTVLALMVFIGEGSLGVHDENLRPALTHGWRGFFMATAFVFVSYAGVTKIASVAEEVKDPGRIIPIGMLVSLGVMVLLYVIVVYIMVGNVPVEKFLQLKKFKDAPLALAGLEVGGQFGLYFLSIVSVLALTAMANAGVLASSRYPFALSRYQQLPGFLNNIHSNYLTPSVSILVTGLLLIVSITFLPVVQLAKLASTFKLIVLGMLNCALIILRESDIEWYQPAFRSPLYPYVQLFGIAASLFLIPFLGVLSMAAAAGLILLGTAWYFLYVRPRVDRKGAIFQSVEADENELEFFERVRDSRRATQQSVIVPFFDLQTLDPLQVERRLRLAASLCRKGERLDVIHFLEVPEQSLLTEHDMNDNDLKMLQERKRLLNDEVVNNIQVDQVITHSSRRALLNYVQEETPHWIVFDWKEPSPWQTLIGIQEWWLENLPCDAFFFEDNGKAEFIDIAVVVEPGPYDGEVVYAARNIANFFESEIRFLNPVNVEDSDRVEYIESYQRELLELTGDAASAEIIPRNKWDATLIERSADLDLIIFGGHKRQRLLEGDSLIRSSTREELLCNYARIKSNLKYPRSILQEAGKEGVDVLHLIERNGAFLRINPDNKMELFTRIAESFDDSEELITDVEDALWEREEIQNTFIEAEIAFPHGILDSMNQTQVRVVLLEDTVTYTQNDDEVSLCIVTVGPSEEREAHLQVLRQLSSVFVNRKARERLDQAKDLDEVLAFLSDYL